METSSSRYREVYAHWRRDPEGFWAHAAQEIDWIEPARQVFDPEAGVYGRWFAGAVPYQWINQQVKNVSVG